MLKRLTNISLKTFNSFGVEATAARMIQYASGTDLREALAEARDSGPWSVLSGGNNILFTGFYEGTLLRPEAKGISITSDAGGKAHIRVEAATEWDDVVAWCVERGLWGLENLSLIPGYAGAAPVQNIGAYGAEFADCAESVEFMAADTLRTEVMPARDCRFGYRSSIFKGELKGRAVITAVNLVLGRTPAPNIKYGNLHARFASQDEITLENIRRAVIEVRRSKLPDTSEAGNAGSFFKNPVVPMSKIEELKAAYPDMPFYPAPEEGYGKLAAGWLIEKAGMKGVRQGHVGVHHSQALVIVNIGGASGAEILDFAGTVQEKVRGIFGVEIDMEVNVL